MFKKILKKIRKLGYKKTFKIALSKIKGPFVPLIHNLRWRFFLKAKKSGITECEYKKPLIISLTTYPVRIHTVHLVIESLLMQTLKPNKIVLWLANEQFPMGEADLPKSLLRLKDFGLTIEWCEDIRSYKKLIPTLRQYPDSLIITADDDLFYNRNMVKKLYNAYLKEPDLIHCHRATKFERNNGQWGVIAGGYDVYSKPTFLHKLTGGSGALYPINSLFGDITNADLFMTLAPTNDDIWFWLMAVLNGKKCNVLENGHPELYFTKGSQATALCNVNDNGEKLFWKQLNNIFEYYPQIEKILIDEWERVSNS